jgi:hypothetical protein
MNMSISKEKVGEAKYRHTCKRCFDNVNGEIIPHTWDSKDKDPRRCSQCKDPNWMKPPKKVLVILKREEAI